MCADKTRKAGKVQMTSHRSNSDGSRDASAAAKSGLDEALSAHIGVQLKAVFNEILSEPVPDHFLKLLDELERKRAETP